MPLAESTQQELHLQRIRSAFADLSLDLAGIDVEIEIGPVLGYRNRIRLQVQDGGMLAFFNPQKEVTCNVLEPELQACLMRLKGERLPGLDTGDSIELRTRDLDGRFGMSVTPPAPVGNSPSDTAALQAALGNEFLIASVGTSPFICQRFRLNESLYFYAPLHSFIQVNFAMNERLVGWIAARALQLGARRFWDLFSGVGNFSLALLGHGLRGIGIEMDGEATRAARLASEQQGLGGDFVESSVQSFLPPASEGAPDVVIVDAPRAGVGELLPRLVESARQAVLLVSCCPETLARDVGVLAANGWRLTGMRAFDMFAQTHHVEVAVELVRG